VDEVQVEIGRAELLEREVQLGLDVLGAVASVPQLGDERDLLAGNSRVLDSGADLLSASVLNKHTTQRRTSAWLPTRPS